MKVILDVSGGWSKPQSLEWSANTHSRRFRGYGSILHTDLKNPEIGGGVGGKPAMFAISAFTVSWYGAEIA
jgi:hypothetical protein